MYLHLQNYPNVSASAAVSQLAKTRDQHFSLLFLAAARPFMPFFLLIFIFSFWQRFWPKLRLNFVAVKLRLATQLRVLNQMRNFNLYRVMQTRFAHEMLFRYENF